MGLKSLIATGAIFLNLFIHLGIIIIIGVKNFIHFSLWFMASALVSSFIFGVMGLLNDDKWKKNFILNKSKVKWTRLLLISLIGLPGMLLAYYSPFLAGTITAFIIVLLSLLYCNDFFYMILLYKDLIEDKVAEKLPKWRWLK